MGVAAQSRAEPVSPSQVRQLFDGWISQNPRRLAAELSTQVREVRHFGDFYVVDLEPAGFVVTAADDWAEPVIAFSANGQFMPDPDGPLWALLAPDMAGRQQTARQVAQRRAGRRTAMTLTLEALTAAERARAKWRNWMAPAARAATAGDEDPWTSAASVSDLRVAPILSSVWNQMTAQGLACYNYYCPPGPDGNANNYYAGCVATAMGQIMRHWQWPATAYGHAYAYAQMPLNPQSGTLTDAQRQQIGRLLRDCGTAVNMSYGSGGSSANMLIVDDALTNIFGFGYGRDIYASEGLDAATRDLVLQSNLAGGYPVMVGLRRSSSGHAVVGDGFGYSSGTLYYHLNLGWGGYYDAWYNLPNVDSSPSYNTVDAFVYNIFKTGSGELIAGRITASGAGVSGAVITATGGAGAYTATSGAYGCYGVQVPSAATYTVTVQRTGYSPAAAQVVTVGTSSAYSSGPCGNYMGADFSLSSYSFSFRATALTNSVFLRWSSPTNYGLTNATVHIRRDTTTYPTSLLENVEVYEGAALHCEDIGLAPGQPYYYTIWLSSNGVDFFEP